MERERRRGEEVPTHLGPSRTSSLSNSRKPSTARIPEVQTGGDYPTVDDKVVRERVRQRIQQRALELNAANVELPQSAAIEPHVTSLHNDVLQTAAQILNKYLKTITTSDEPMELVLVHRMLEKEVELQALQQRRVQRNE